MGKNTDIPEGVLYPPGKEPEQIKKKLFDLFEKLDSAYPDKIIVGLHNEYKSLGKKVTSLYRLLGYPDGNSFLTAYGYSAGTSANSGGRPSSDPMLIINELKKRYPQGSGFTTVKELKADNPDIASKFQNLQNQGKKFFGMAFSKYLVQEGILSGGNKVDGDEFSKLKARYADKPFDGTLNELKAENADIDWNVIKSCYTKSRFDGTFKVFLIAQGILVGESSSIEDKLTEITEELKKRYPYDKKFFGSLEKLKLENKDLPVSKISNWAMNVFQLTAKDYLIREGIMAENKPAVKKESKICAEDKPAVKKKSKIQAELNAPVETIYYDPPVYYVEEIKVNGEEAKDWEYDCCDNEIYIKDYIGDKNHIIIPTFINGIRVKKITNSGLQLCRASIIEIPGSIDINDEYIGYQNENIEAIIIGEGIKSIGDCFFSYSRNLKDIKVSRSVVYVGELPFNMSSWLEAQENLIIIGSELFEVKKDCTVLNVPHGIKTIGSFVAAFNSKLRKVILPETVTMLYEDAFAGGETENIQEFVFGESLVDIRFNSFGNNKWTKKFDGKPLVINNHLYQYKTKSSVATIPEGVVRICDKVFYENKYLKSVVLPDSLKIIEEQAFAVCPNLKKVQLNDGLQTIGMAVFDACSELEEVNIPDSLVEISRSTFNSCSSLTEITLGNSVEVIGKRAFMDCSALKNITMNDSVKTIVSEAFRGCKELRTIRLPDTVTEIGEEAFNGCHSLDNIVIPKGVSKIADSAFRNCESLKTIELHDGITEIGSSAFENCSGITEIKLPEKVGSLAFHGCTSLLKVVFSEGMTEIGVRCFTGCSALEEVVIPDSVEKIGEAAFWGCTNLKKVRLPSSLKEIGKYAFRNCHSLIDIVIPAGVTVIDDGVFENCTALTDIEILGKIGSFGVDAFKDTPYIKEKFGDYVVFNGVLSKYIGSDKNVTIPDNVTAIDENAFAEAYHIESILIPDTVRTIANKVMGSLYDDNKNYNLKKLVIGNGVTAIGDEAFRDCRKLKEVIFGENLKTIGVRAFAGCKNLKVVDLSCTSITEIKSSAFYGCYDVKTLKLPDSVEVIGDFAFSDSYIDVVSLPKSVKVAGRNSFERVSELIVYDTIDPVEVDESQWEHGKWDSDFNPNVIYYLRSFSYGYKVSRSHITVVSAETEKIRYRIFCDTEERDSYHRMLFSAWGKNASFNFDVYDDYFMKTWSQSGRTEMAFCRIQYPEGLSAEHRANYEAFLERCMFIERSARRTAELIAEEDSVERLQILAGYKAIDEHNIDWIREELTAKNAKKCIAYLDENFQGKEA